jgi:hypothetical protein
VALSFLAAFVFGRESAVSALPGLAGLYAAAGLPVNPSGLLIADLHVTRPAAGLTVSFMISNLTSETVAISAVLVELRDARRAVVHQLSVPPPVDRLPAGSAAPFAFNLQAAPNETKSVVVRLAGPRYGKARILSPTRIGW